METPFLKKILIRRPKTGNKVNQPTKRKKLSQMEKWKKAQSGRKITKNPKKGKKGEKSRLFPGITRKPIMERMVS